ncbi:MAG: hypothetical protein ACR2OY_06400 [Boseongicola sp.]
MQSKPDLEARLLEAHAVGDLVKIASSYALAADQAEEKENFDRACFFLTHAWIFALEAGDAAADKYRKRLAEYGRA